MIESIIYGKTPKPPIILLYGQEGVGKSTFAAKAPKTVFIPTEDGLNEIDCAKFPTVKTYPEFLATLKAVLNEEHDFETLAVDSISATERMLFKYVCERHGVETIQQANGGYGKGYTEYTNRWGEVLEILSAIREKRNMSIILVNREKLVVTLVTNENDERTTQTIIGSIQLSRQFAGFHIDSLFFETSLYHLIFPYL